MWLGGNAFYTLMFAITLFTMWEVHTIMQKAGASDYFPVSLIFAFLIWRGTALPDWLIVAAVSAIILITIWAIVDRTRESASRWLSTLLTGVYAPVGFLMVVQIRDLGTGIEGFWLTLTLFLMIWGNDVFAYFGGKNFGKRKLAPNISPNKTWEGFWSGFIGAAVGFTIAWALAASYPLPFWSVIGAVVIVSIMGPIGDILESRLKRTAGVKDSSSLLPGHGGFFDRFDSTIMAAPFLWFYSSLFVVF